MSGDDEATRLPHAVHIKTPTRTFNLFFYFALDDAGRIWVKSIPGASRRTDAFAPDWCLFLGTGLPHDGTRADFAAPRRIDLINADLDELMAVSDLHRLYTVRWFENPVFAEPTRARTWADLHGRPNPAPLRWDAHVEHNRGYAIGRRTRSFALFEDIARRTFDGGGGLSTYYILRGDGTSIAYFDPGLPADFSHTIGGPDRSTFVAEAMAVSGDTIFVINAYGEPRTRTMDFAGDGSDTMFLVDRQDRGARSEAATSAACAWATHSSIPLEGQAQIASQLAIVPTGQHLCDRELRVAGYDRDRRSGYYFQRICDPGLDEPPREDWCFVPDESVVLDPACLLDPADTDPSAVRSVARVPLPTRWPNAARPPRRVAPRNMWFTGALWVDDQRLEVRAELLDFHFDWSPARFRLTAGKASRESIEVTLHTAEQWASRRRCDPGHDGTPKAIRATLELSTAAFATDQPILRALVGDVLARYHLVAFAWLVQATEHELRIESKPARQTVPAWPRVALHLVRAHRSYASSAAPPSAPRDECFTAAARAPALRIGRPLGELTSADATALVAKISHNLYAASTMITAAAAPVRQDVAEPSWLQHSVLGAQRYAARPWLPATALPLLPFRSVSASEAARYAKNVATVLPRLLARNRELKDDLLNRTRQDLAHALMLIDTRTAAYAWRLAQLAGTTAA
ncbi:MAG: hypothetical protein ABIY55_22780, partial [Kofleriaceae bacterium]